MNQSNKEKSGNKNRNRALSNNENEARNKCKNENENENELSMEIIEENSINSDQNNRDRNIGKLSAKKSDISANYYGNNVANISIIVNRNIDRNAYRKLKSGKISEGRTWGVQNLDLCDGTNGIVKPLLNASSTSGTPVCIDFLTEMKTQGKWGQLNIISVPYYCWCPSLLLSLSWEPIIISVTLHGSSL